MEPNAIGYLALGLFAALVLYVAYQLLTKGYKGAMFGARVLNRSPKIVLDGDWLTAGHVRVYALKAGGRELVGIEINSGLMVETATIRLTPETAHTLAEAIEAAADQAQINAGEKGTVPNSGDTANALRVFRFHPRRPLRMMPRFRWNRSTRTNQPRPARSDCVNCHVRRPAHRGSRLAKGRRSADKLPRVR